MKTVYSVCGMCGTRCPVAVGVENGEAVWIQGNSPRGHGFGIVSSRHRGTRAGERFRASAVAAAARGVPWRAQVARRRLGRGA